MQGIQPNGTGVAPVRMMLAIGVGALLLVALSVWQLAANPWLGVDLAPAPDGNVTVTEVHQPGPAVGQLETGDRLVALRGGDGEWHSLQGFDPRLEPHNLASFADYNDYLSHHRKLAETIAAGPVELVTRDGELHAITPAEYRPLRAFPPGFWLFHLFGLIALLISVAVWSFRRSNPSARLLALSGVGFFLATLFHAVFGSRDPGTDAFLFEFALRANHIAQTVTIGSLAILLISYPRRVTRFPVAACLVPILTVYQLNEIFQWTEVPPHTFYGPIIALYLTGLVLGWVQWRATAGIPADRAALKWVLLFVLMSMGIGVAVYIVPVMLDLDAPTSPLFLVGFATMLYVGFALGVLRYRLFDLEHWWFSAWLWFLSGLSIIIIDLALVLMLGLGPLESLWIAILAVAWLYFPLRQWLWRRMVNYSRSDLEQAMPRLMQKLFSAGSPDTADEVWMETLDALFQPLELEYLSMPVTGIRLESEGAGILVPSISGDGGVSMVYAMKGNRLFQRRDIEALEQLLEVGRQAYQLRQAEAEGVRREQARIMRDLHDDVGGRVLTLIHSASDQRQADLARRALSALRDSIRALDNRERISLQDLLQVWQEDAAERLGHVGVRFEPRGIPDLLTEIELSARQQINLRRILDEAITNMIRHAEPRYCRFQVEYRQGRLYLHIRNDGVPSEIADVGQVPRGRGLHNISNRAAELGGKADIRLVEEGQLRWFEIAIEVPLE